MRLQDFYIAVRRTMKSEDSFEETPASSPNHGITVRWSSVSLILAVVAFAAVAVLVVLVSTKRADLLTTVALLLAVLSFAAQLIVTASQSQSAESHYRELSNLSKQSSHALRAIEVRQNAMFEGQQGTVEKLLNAVIERTTSPESLARILGRVEAEDPQGADTDDEGRDDGTREAISYEVATQLKEALLRNASVLVKEAAQADSADDPMKDLAAKQHFALRRLERFRELDFDSALAFVDALKHAQGANRTILLRLNVNEERPKWLNGAKDLGLVRSARIGDTIRVTGTPHSSALGELLNYPKAGVTLKLRLRAQDLRETLWHRDGSLPEDS